MPYFKWRGVNIVGQTQRGKLFAQSQTDLDALLLRKNIALLSCKSIVIIPLFFRISAKHKIEFFSQLHELLTAGILLPNALTIVAQQAEHILLQQTLNTIAHQVHSGRELSTALSNYPKLFDPMTLQLAHVGQNSNRLSASLAMIFNYLQTKQDFYSRIRSALFMPIITLIFFTSLSAIILVVILPRFATMFASLGKQLPPLTQKMIYFSSVVASWKMIYLLAALIGIIIIIKLYTRTVHGTYMRDSFILKIPFIGRIVQYHFISYFLQSIALLLSSGMQLLPALRSIESIVYNHVLRSQVHAIANDVQTGASLSEAINSASDTIFPPDVIAMVTIGQQVGTLEDTLKRAATIYRQKAEKLLQFVTIVINPLLLLILGALVLLLIFTIYMPILNMSHAI